MMEEPGQHPMADVKTRKGCWSVFSLSISQLKMGWAQNQPVHIRDRTWGWLAWARLQHPPT